MEGAETEDNEASQIQPTYLLGIHPSGKTGTGEQRTHAKDIQRWNQQDLVTDQKSEMERKEEVKNGCDVG